MAYQTLTALNDGLVFRIGASSGGTFLANSDAAKRRKSGISPEIPVTDEAEIQRTPRATKGAIRERQLLLAKTSLRFVFRWESRDRLWSPDRISLRPDTPSARPISSAIVLSQTGSMEKGHWWEPCGFRS